MYIKLQDTILNSIHAKSIKKSLHRFENGDTCYYIDFRLNNSDEESYLDNFRVTYDNEIERDIDFNHIFECLKKNIPTFKLGFSNGIKIQ